MFVGGKQVETLTSEETFAVGAVLNKLRLASYTVEREGKTCSLTIKHNASDIKLQTSKSDYFTLDIRITMSAGALDISKAQDIEDLGSVGNVPKEFFTVAEKKLISEIQRVYEKCRACGCDIFGVRERLVKYGKRSFQHLEAVAFSNTRANISVHFRNIR